MPDTIRLPDAALQRRLALSPSRRGRRFLPLLLTAWLVACGGDGGDTPSSNDPVGPPTTGASLSNSSTEASSSAQGVVAGADAAASHADSLTGLAVLFGTPIGAAATTPSAASVHAQAAAGLSSTGPSMHALAVRTAACTDLLDSPCSGSATLDTNIADTATAIHVGDYADLRFSSLTGLLFGESVGLNGRLRLDFQSGVSLTASQFAGLDVKLTLDGFSGSVNGAAFGPISEVGQLQIDSQGVASITASGARYTGLSNVTFTGAGNYGIGSGSIRLGYWSDSGKYVDLSLLNWHVVNGRPAVGSQATVAGAQGSLTLSVTASSAASVVYAVVITAAGSTIHYVVTATYPGGGAAPSYSAVPG